MDSFRCNHGVRIVPGQFFTIPIAVEELSVLDLEWSVTTIPSIFSSDDAEVDFSIEFASVDSGKVTLLDPSRLSTDKRNVNIERPGTCILRWHNGIDGWFGGSSCELYYTIVLRRDTDSLVAAGQETRESKLERLQKKTECLRADLAAKNASISDQHGKVIQLKASHADLENALESNKASWKKLEQRALDMHAEMERLISQQQENDDACSSSCLVNGRRMCALPGCMEFCDDHQNYCCEIHRYLHDELKRLSKESGDVHSQAADASGCSEVCDPIDLPSVDNDAQAGLCDVETRAANNDAASSTEVSDAKCESPKTKSITCDKCDGPHATDSCPHFKKTREKHKDAWAHYGSKNPRLLGATKENFVLCGGRRVPQPGDGNCLFHSLCYGLNAGKSIGRISAGELRSQLATFISRNPHLEIAGDSLEEWVRWDTNSSTSAYASRMSRSGWGGGLEMAACSLLKNVNVHVYENSLGGFKRISRFDCPGKASKTVHVLYQGGVHYDALLP